MKTKFNLLAITASFCVPFSMVASCQSPELEALAKVEKQLILEATPLVLPKTGVYDDGKGQLVFEDKNTSGQPIYQYHGETFNNANLAVNDTNTLSMMKGKNAIELLENDTVVVDLNFINQYRQGR